MGHHRCRLLMSNVDSAHAVIEARLFGAQHRRAHEKEKCLYAMTFERLGNEFRTGDGHQIPL
jgi:hypothetical protein